MTDSVKKGSLQVGKGAIQSARQFFLIASGITVKLHNVLDCVVKRLRNLRIIGKSEYSAALYDEGIEFYQSLRFDLFGLGKFFLRHLDHLRVEHVGNLSRSKSETILRPVYLLRTRSVAFP